MKKEACWVEPPVFFYLLFCEEKLSIFSVSSSSICQNLMDDGDGVNKLSGSIL